MNRCFGRVAATLTIRTRSCCCAQRTTTGSTRTLPKRWSSDSRNVTNPTNPTSARHTRESAAPRTGAPVRTRRHEPQRHGGFRRRRRPVPGRHRCSVLGRHRLPTCPQPGRTARLVARRVGPSGDTPPRRRPVPGALRGCVMKPASRTGAPCVTASDEEGARWTSDEVGERRIARRLCLTGAGGRPCPHLAACGEEASRLGILFGVWGGEDRGRTVA